MPAARPAFSCRIAGLVCLALAVPAPAAAPTVPEEAVRLAIDLLGRDDADFRTIGLDGVRHGLRGVDATRRFASLLTEAAAPRQAALVQALADRGDPAALPAITATFAATQDPDVRRAALVALGRLGGAAEVAPLVASVVSQDRDAAVQALIELRGPEAAAAILAAARSAEPAPRAKLYEVLAARRERAALGDLVTAATANDATVRTAAMRALAVLGGPEQVPALAAGVLAAAAGGERDAAERALLAVCRRDGTGPAATTRFLETFQAANAADREQLVPALGRIGGPDALAIVDALVTSSEPDRRALGLAALARWPNAAVADRLLGLIDGVTDPGERTLLLGALIRIAPLPDNGLDDRRRLALLTKAFGLCRSDAERIKVIDRADAIRTVETLRFVVPHLDTPALAEAACGSVVELAHHRSLRDAHKEEFTRALDKVLTITADAETRDRAERYQQGRTWERKRPG